MKLFTFLLLGGLCLPLGYLLAVTIAAYRFQKKTAGGSPPLHMGVVIPAHNESTGIGKTIQTVWKSDYPSDRLTIMVIADNCDDDTAEAARRTGATVFERRDPGRRGKGFALDWFLRECQGHYRDLDAVTILDADVEIDPACLREISDSLSHPEIRVVQGYNGVSNPRAGWRPALCDAAFNIFNHLRMAGPAQLAGVAVLKGLGMGFRTEVLMRYGWPAHSIVEDQEFTLTLLRDGIAVHYNPDAVVRSEMVTTGDRAIGQRARWEGGRFSLMRRMIPTMIGHWIKQPDARYLYALCELAIPPLSLLVIATTLSTAATALWLPKGLWLAALQWLILIAYGVSGQIQRRASLSTWFYLVTAPFFILWKIPLYFKMLTGITSAKWSRTSREAEVNTPPSRR